MMIEPDKGTGFRPGWGILNGGHRHWVRPDFTRACEPGVLHYGGETKGNSQVTLGECCPDCVVIVLSAQQVLG
jgi:hypothetical protein